MCESRARVFGEIGWREGRLAGGRASVLGVVWDYLGVVLLGGAASGGWFALVVDWVARLGRGLDWLLWDRVLHVCGDFAGFVGEGVGTGNGERSCSRKGRLGNSLKTLDIHLLQHVSHLEPEALSTYQWIVLWERGEVQLREICVGLDAGGVGNRRDEPFSSTCSFRDVTDSLNPAFEFKKSAICSTTNSGDAVFPLRVHSQTSMTRHPLFLKACRLRLSLSTFC